MNKKIKSAFAHSIAFMSGNYVYQLFQVLPDYAEATERTFFQLAIVLFVLWKLRDAYDERKGV